MATAYQIRLDQSTAGAFHAQTTTDTAERSGKALQEDLENHHVFFNLDGFHNHISHHILTLYSLGATATEIQKAFDDNKTYQRPPQPVHDDVVDRLVNKANFTQYLGKDKYYADFLKFFQNELDTKGLEATMHEHVFARDEHADRMFGLLWAGFMHPLIQLGFGIEYQQPAIVAEGLAQAAVHDDWQSPMMFRAEKDATTGSGKHLAQLVDEMHDDEKLAAAPHWKDANKIRDGLMRRAPDETLHYMTQWVVKEDEIKKKEAEMINNAAYFTAASQRPTKVPKLDFYYMHCVTSSIFFSSFLALPWLSNASKARMLEWKGRVDLVLYASRAAPKLYIDRVSEYTPQSPHEGTEEEQWASIFKRVNAMSKDDGHVAKVIRALAHAQIVCRPYENARGDEDAFRVRGDMWLKMAYLTIESTEGQELKWVRSAGFDEAWEKVEDIKQDSERL